MYSRRRPIPYSLIRPEIPYLECSMVDCTYIYCTVTDEVLLSLNHEDREKQIHKQNEIHKILVFIDSAFFNFVSLRHHDYPESVFFF
jgi:hypothetical protein